MPSTRSGVRSITSSRAGEPLLVGVISDTHGYTDPRLVEVFRGVDFIVHAGDIGTPDVLDRLAEIAPVLAVRGNVDRHPSLLAVPERLDLSFEGVELIVVHRAEDAAPGAATRVVITGHSHRAVAAWRDRILYVNPGAAGRHPFHRDRTVCLLRLVDPPTTTLVHLGPRARENEGEQMRST